MAVIDSQVHVYEADSPERPWADSIWGPEHVTGDEQVAAMDALGIDGAIIVSTYTTYRYDGSYAQDVQARHPGRFALVKPVDPADPAVAEDIAQWSTQPGAVGIRVMLAFAGSKDPESPGLNLVLAEGARHGLPVNLYATGHLDEARTLIARNPDTVVLIDHLGLPQSFRRKGDDVWADLPRLLALAGLDNVRIKLTGAGTMSDMHFPYDDIWDPVLRIVDAFGVERCLWGTDWTRAVKQLSYEQGVVAFRANPRFSASDRAMLMGGAAERTYGWAPVRSVKSLQERNSG